MGVATKKATRSVSPWNKFQQRLGQDGVDVLNLGGKTRSINASNVIELSNLKNPASLQDNPLELTVQEDLTASETLIPVTLNNDGLIIQIGTSEKQADS